MSKQVGVWIDHRQAILVFIGEGSERTERMESSVEKHARVAGLTAEDASPDDQRDRQFAGHLNHYYDEVIKQLGDVDSILVLGPGEAKGEFRKRLEAKGLSGRIVGTETVDKMTDPQIAAKVREHFKA